MLESITYIPARALNIRVETERLSAVLIYTRFGVGVHPSVEEILQKRHEMLKSHAVTERPRKCPYTCWPD